jgi:hypothetical protein
MTSVKNDTSVSIFKKAMEEWNAAPPEDRDAVIEVLHAHSTARRKQIAGDVSERKLEEICKGMGALGSAIDLLGNSKGLGVSWVQL